MEATKEPTQAPKHSKPKKEKGGNRAGLIILILLLLGGNGFLLMKFFSANEQATTLAATNKEKDEKLTALNSEYENFKKEYEAIKQKASGLEGQLSEKEKEIEKIMQALENEKKFGGRARIGFLESQLAKLKLLAQQRDHELDSLIQVNQKLVEEKTVLSTDLTQQRSKNDQLSQENSTLSNKVQLGSIMKATEIKALGVKFKSSGKEMESQKAKSVQKVKACFTLLENRVVEKGTVEVFIRIMGPDGSVLSTGSETFMYNGQATIYTTKQEVNYENKDTDLCVYWAKGSEFAKGKYSVEIYAGGNQIGTSAFELK